MTVSLAILEERMKGLKIIPFVLIVIGLSFLGAFFIERNPDLVSVNFIRAQTPPMKLGFIVLTSFFVGMSFSALLCSVELFTLYFQNRRLKRRLASVGGRSSIQAAPPPRLTSLPQLQERRVEPISMEGESQSMKTGQP